MENTVKEALEAIRNGEFVIVLDDKNRENEGDLIIAADKITQEKIGFMVRHTSGLICVSMTSDKLNELQIPLMCMENNESQKTAFTVSVDYAHGTTSGISAYDRTLTIQALNNSKSKAMDFKRPGHIFPLRYQSGGVLKRAGHTEAAMDLAVMSGTSPCGVLCEIVNDDGSMARGKQIDYFAQKHNLKVITIEDLIQYRIQNELHVKKLSQSNIPTNYGDFNISSYYSPLDDQEHLVLIKGYVAGKRNVLVRIHSECFTGDVLGSKRCDCREQFELAMKLIADKGEGILIYMRGHEGRGIGISQKLNAYNLQDQGLDTVEANLNLGLPVDRRNYYSAAQILKELQVKSVSLLSNNPSKIEGIKGFSFEVEKRVALSVTPTSHNFKYLITKQEKMGHHLNLTR